MAGEEQNKNSFRDAVSKPVINIVNYVRALPPVRKRMIFAALGGLIAVAIGLTLFLNARATPGYRALYPGMTDTAEASEVYFAAQELGAQPQLDSRGQVLVPAGQYEFLLLQLAARGFPKSTLAYDVFANHSGMTATEAEKKQWLLFQLQDRIQDTLTRIEGVSAATVTLNIPEDDPYVWSAATASRETATASALLTLRDDIVLDGEQVTAIKNLIAFSVPKMEAANVKVLDGRGRELVDLDGESASFNNYRNLEIEQEVQRRIEENIRQILTPRYGQDGVFVAARVTLDYDTLISEDLTLKERAAEIGGGFPSRRIVEWVTDGRLLPAGGIAGEEDNTDIPTYLQNNGINDGDLSNYYGSEDLSYGHTKTQTEKNGVTIKRATISVMVAEDNLTENRRAELVGLISNAADIAPEFISLAALIPGQLEVEAPPAIVVPSPEETALPLWLYILAGAGVLLIGGLITVVVLMRRRSARLAMEAEEQLKQQTEDMESEIDRYKQELAAAAKASVNPKDDAITDEVRQFAKDNPEITANLLRNWLKEAD